jgi:[protein-PII] uridylyltransferase
LGFKVPEFVKPHIQQEREFLVTRRDEIQTLHREGTAGSQIVAALTVLIDAVVSRLTNAALQDSDSHTAAAFESSIALVAIGGYGRAELAPFSDVDLMFLYDPAAKVPAQALCSRLVRDFWDARLVLGSSMRTLAECVSLANQDVSVHTALLEARHLVGNPWLTGELRDRIGRLTRGRNGDGLIRSIQVNRLTEQSKSGANVHLLEPDVKRSKGGLRELHVLRWVAHARFGVASIDRLERDGHLPVDDAVVLREAREFLLRIRNELHFHAGRAQDTLSWDEQARLATVFRYQNRPGMLAVEQFMQRYYRHSAAIDDTTDRFIRRWMRPPFWHRFIRPFLTQRIDGSCHIFAGQLTPTPESLGELLTSLDQILQLFSIANRRGVVVADDVREQIRMATPLLNEGDLLKARSTFLRMLDEPGNLAQTLHHLNALGILEKLIPEFAHAKGLIQFNQYHKYTVDEHTLICVANAERFLKDDGALGKAYREIGSKEILHLALLLHDLGKGFESDHSELGAQIAEKTAERFELDVHRRDLLVFLVRKHLLMAHLAFRRDTSDAKLLADFARQVGTPEVLRMLFVLTAADIASVGPETWTSWKSEVLSELFGRTMETLGGPTTSLDPDARAAEVRQQVQNTLGGRLPGDWLQQQFAAMTTSYLIATPADRIVEHLTVIRQLPQDNVLTTAKFDPQTRITTYTVYTVDQITPGLFSKISGVLAAKGLQILSAQITTLTNGEVIDRFEVLDYDYSGTPPPPRMSDVAATIGQVLRGERSIESVFKGSARVGPRYQSQPGSMHEPTQVNVDNESSERCTIIEVFAHDRQGLLYVITRTIFELGLSVSVAKVATSLDQVLDVFYVTDQSGHKVTDTGRLEQFQKRLVDAIEAFDTAESKSNQPRP